MRGVLLLLMSLLLMSLLLATTASASEIVALGASNTHGKGKGRHPDGVERSQAYPAQLQAMLRQQGCRAQVVNAGIAGDTTGGMLARLPSTVTKRTRVVILQPGGNDALFNTGADRAGNITQIETELTRRGITMIVLDQLGRIARAHRLPDGQHFSAEGHAAFAAYLLPRVISAGACS
jgi:acyl-CoA thioesterase-1